MCKNKTLLLFALVCMMIGLFAALMPFSDIDQDGLWDSLVTDGLILLPIMLCSAAGLYRALDKIPAAYIAAPRLFSSPLFSPPIFN